MTVGEQLQKMQETKQKENTQKLKTKQNKKSAS